MSPRLSAQVARLPTDFLVVGSVFFALGVIALPVFAPRALEFFYQPLLLALVHTFTLGFITSTIIGVMYRYVPALTRSEIRYPRLAIVQLVLYVIGVIGMIGHFSIGAWSGTWMSAVLVVISVILFAHNLLPCLWPRVGAAAAESGMFLSIIFLLAAAVVGTLLAMDKVYGFLSGSLLSNLAGHVGLAGLGWVTLTICAVSYRFVPAFILPKTGLPRSATWQLFALSIGVIGLTASAFFHLGGILIWSALIALALLAYVATLARLVRSRRMPILWPLRHALAGVVWLVVGIALGLTLAQIGSGSFWGNRVAAAWGVVGLLGWIGNFIIGMSYELFPGFVSKARATLSWPAIRVRDLSIVSTRPAVFVCFNAGVAILTFALLTGAPWLIRGGGALIAVGGVIYAAVTLKTLSYAYAGAMPNAGRIAAVSPQR